MVRCFLLLIGITLSARAQELSFGPPERLKINNGCEEFFPMLSADGRELYFVRSNCATNVGGKYAGADIWISYLNNARGWTSPTNTKYNLNNKFNNAIVGISKDGKTIYQLNTTAAKNITGIQVLNRLGKSWSKGETIPVSFLKTEQFLGVFIDRAEKVMLLSMQRKDSRGEEDLYVSTKSSTGEWSVPHNLGPVINTGRFEISPFLSTNGTRLFFSSNGHGGVGDADIFYSDRLDESWENWSDPVNLVEINSAHFDAYFSFYDTLAFFSSNRAGEFSDIYQLRLKKPVNKEEQRAQKIIAEANMLLNDLRDDTTDSLAREKVTVIEFEENSIRMENGALEQLKGLVIELKKSPVHKITLVGYSSDSDVQHMNLSLKRLESIKTYFSEFPVQRAVVETEVRKYDKQWASKKDSVEVRYK